MSHRRHTVPRGLAWFLEKLVPDPYGTELLEDLREEARAPARWRRYRFTLWCWWQVVRPSTWRLAVAVRRRQRSQLPAQRSARSVLDDALQDVWIALRAYRRRTGFTLVAICILALGIGASATIASLARALLWRQLPFPNSEELMIAWGTNADFGQVRDVIFGPNYIDLRERNTVFSAYAAFKTGGATLYSNGTPVPTDGLWVTPEFFTVLQVSPLLGRTFRPEDGLRGRDDVAVISHGLWTRHFGADRSAVGRPLETYDRTYTVIGVLPPTFSFPHRADLVTPLAYDMLAEQGRTSINYWTIGRLRTGVTSDQAEHNLSAIMSDVRQAHPRVRGWEITVEPYEAVLREYARPAVLLLAGIVIVLLMIACANISNLLLARAVERSREIAVRRSIGATAGRVRQQLLTESAVLASIGGLVGWGLAALAVTMLPAVLPETVPVPGSAAAVLLPAISLDGGTLAFTVGVTLLTVLLFGFVPALHASREDWAAAMRSSGPNRTAGHRSLRTQRAVIVSQLAFTLILVSVGVLTLQSTLRLMRTDPGFDPHDTITLYFGNLDAWSDAQRSAYYGEVLRAIHGVPGIRAFGINDYVPLQQEDDFHGFTVDRIDGPEHYRAEWRRVSSGFFAAGGIRLVRGRFFTESDDELAPSVVIVNEAMAARYWPGEDPVGKRFRIHERGFESSVIVGVVGDVRLQGLDRAAPPVMYVPYYRKPRPVVALFARADGDPMEFLDPLKRAIWSVDPRQPIERVQTLDRVVDQSVAVPRLVLVLVWCAGLSAIVLATVGVYGVTSYTVRQRFKELSIRMALGATRERIHCDVVGTTARPTMLGVVLGLAGTFAASRIAASLLFDVRATEWLPYLTGGVMITIVASAAAYLSARRASGLDPMQSLRNDV